jgi:type IV secretion system protein VirD4
VKDAFEAATLWIRMLWGILEAVYKAQKWLRKKIKMWRRQPAYGVSKWATDAELTAAGHFKPVGFVAGVRNGKVIYSGPESCVLMAGMRGSGKSLTMCASLARASGQKFVVCDPPGNVMEMTRPWMEKKGYKVLVVDVENPVAGLKYDPICYLENSSRYEWHPDLHAVAELIVADLPKGKDAEHFSRMGAKIITGVMGYLFLHERRIASIYEVAKILTVSADHYRDMMFDKMLSIGDDTTISSINAFIGAGTNEKGSFRSTLTNALEVWTWYVYQDLCSYNPDCDQRLNWDEFWLSPEPGIVYIVGGLAKGEQFRAIMRMLIGQAVLSAARIYSRTRKPLIDPAWLFVDEMPTLGRCNPLLKVVNEMRKVGMNLWMGVQSPSQVEEIYGEKGYKIFMDNCDLWLSGAGKDDQTYERISRLLGDTTITTLSSDERGMSESENSKRMMNVSDVFKLERLEHICLMGNLAVKSHKPFEIRNGKPYFY